MIETILSTMLPVLVTLLLGFVAAWHHDFNSREATILNRMVLTYAVPLSVFVGTVSTTRTNLLNSIPLALSILVGIVGMYAIVYALSRHVFRFATTTSALAALAASGPAVPFLGPAILGGMFGAGSAVPIAVASIVINITIVPFTIFVLTMGAASKPAAVGASVSPAVEAPKSAGEVLVEHLQETIKKPLVWAPILGFVMVLADIHFPEMLDRSFELLGRSSAGVALFAAGIVLAAYKFRLTWYTSLFALVKNVVQPALVFGGLIWLGFSGPVVSQAVMTMAIPVMPIVVMLSLEYGVAEEHAPSVLLLSTVGSLFTVGGFIWLTA